MLVPGIDAGNSRFKYAAPDETGTPRIITNRFGEAFTPSAVFFNPDGSTIVGTEALNAGFIDPDRLVTNWKRDMGTETNGTVICKFLFLRWLAISVFSSLPG